MSKQTKQSRKKAKKCVRKKNTKSAKLNKLITNNYKAHNNQPSKVASTHRKAQVQSSAKVSLPSIFKGIIKGVKKSVKKVVSPASNPSTLHTSQNSLESNIMGGSKSKMQSKKHHSALTPCKLANVKQSKKKRASGQDCPSTGWSTQANANSRPHTLSKEYMALKKIFDSKPKSKSEKTKKKAKIKAPDKPKNNKNNKKKDNKKILDLRQALKHHPPLNAYKSPVSAKASMAAWYRETDVQKRKLKSHNEREKARGRGLPVPPGVPIKNSPNKSSPSPKNRPPPLNALQRVVASKTNLLKQPDVKKRKDTPIKEYGEITPLGKQSDKKCQIPTIQMQAQIGKQNISKQSRAVPQSTGPPLKGTVPPPKGALLPPKGALLPPKGALLPPKAVATQARSAQARSATFQGQQQQPQKRVLGLLQYIGDSKRPQSQPPQLQSTQTPRTKWWQWQINKPQITQARRAKLQQSQSQPMLINQPQKRKGKAENDIPMTAKEEKKALREIKKFEKQQQFDQGMKEYVAYLHKQKQLGRKQADPKGIPIPKPMTQRPAFLQRPRGRRPKPPPPMPPPKRGRAQNAGGGAYCGIKPRRKYTKAAFITLVPQKKTV